MSPLLMWHLASIRTHALNGRFRGEADYGWIMARGGSVANDPNVWSGRASQEVFVDLAVSGFASMYPASDWSVLCSGPSWISARLPNHHAQYWLLKSK